MGPGGRVSTSKKKGESASRERAGMRKEKRKEGKDPEGGSKKRKEVANDKPLKN